MPPKPKNTREEIATAAFAIIREEGLDALSARALGKRLNSSAGSIFTLYDSMEEVKLAARELALAEFNDYISDFRNYMPPFKRIGMMIVSYGLKQPELFKLLFMQEHKTSHSFRETIRDLGEVYDVSIDLMVNIYRFTEKEARFMFEQLWTLAFGLGTMCAMGVCQLKEEEISIRLGAGFMSHLMFIKSGNMKEAKLAPKQAEGGPEQGMDISILFAKLFGEEKQEG